MILCIIQSIENARNLLLSAWEVSRHFNKRFAVTLHATEFSEKTYTHEQLISFFQTLKITADYIGFNKETINNFKEICEENEVSFLLVQLSKNKTKEIQHILNACRPLRIPYLIYKESFNLLNFNKILLPVSFLVEEVEKAQFASAFGRFFGSDISILLAKDYGSKAMTNSQKIISVLEKFNINAAIIRAKKDSFKINQEALKVAENDHFDLIIVTASREYGLDDLIFGSMEQKLIKKSTIPILLINPRDDLYVLCD